MGNTIQKSDSAFLSFLERLREAGVKDKDIDGAVADTARGGPTIGTCKVPGPGDGRVERAEVFALALNNLTKHGDSIRRFFHQIGFTEIEQLQNDGQFSAAYRKKVQSELLGSEPRRSLKAWPNPDKLKPDDPKYAKELATWALANTRLGLLPFHEQMEVFKKFGVAEAAAKPTLVKHWQNLTLPKILAQASVLKGEDLLLEARDRRRVGGKREAQELESTAHRLFQTAVELDGKNPQARLRLAESLERKERFSEAGLHYAQAIVDGVSPAEVDKILERLSFESGREMLGKHRDAYSFVGAHLIEAGRYVEAAALYHRAAEAATDAGQHQKSQRFTELEMLAQEKFAPFTTEFTADSNPVAQALYASLREAGIPSGLIDGASGREGDVPDQKISAAEVFGYLDSHWKDKRVQRAMDKIGFELPWLNSKGRVKKEFDTPDFTKLHLMQRYAAWHQAKVERLKADGLGGDSGLIEKHLKFAVHCDPENAAHQKALGDFYLGQKDGTKAKAAYAAAQAADPTRKDLALPMARALSLNGEKGPALKSYQTYLAAYPKDEAAKKESEAVSSEFLAERTKAFDGQLSAFKLLTATHPDKAEQALKDLEATLGELQSLKSSGPEQSYERLLRTQEYYKAAIAFRNSRTPTLSFWDSSPYDKYQAQTKELERALDTAKSDVTALLEGEIRPAMIASGVSTGDEIAMAKLALRIDRESGSPSDLVHDMQTAIALVQALPPSTPAAEKAEHFAALLREWSDPSNLVRNNLFAQGATGISPTEVQGIGEDLKAGILNSSPAEQRPALTALIDKTLAGDMPKIRVYLAPGGLAKYLEESQATDTAFAEAKALKDPAQMRGAMLEVLASYAKLGRSAEVDAVLQAVDATFTDQSKGEDRLQMTTALLGVLRGSGLPQEKKLREQGDILARQMAVCVSDPRVNARRRMAEVAYYSSVGDSKNLEDAQRGLARVADDLLNFLHGGNPQAKIPKPTDAKTRIELASMAVEIDMALLGLDAKDASESKTRGVAALSVKIPRLEVLSREISKATDLPPEERVVALGLLRRASASYEPLTQGEKPLLPATESKKLVALNELADSLMAKSFDELLQQPAEASPAQQKMAAKIAEDFKTRYRAAVKAGDQAWLSNLTPQSIKEFAEYSQGAHALLLDAAELKGPRGFERRLQAAKIFSELGLGERVQESLEPVKLYVVAMKDPQAKAGALFTLAQLYQGGGRKAEAEEMFGSIEALGAATGAGPALKEMGTLATGMRQLNAGDMREAQATLASIPENPTAQLLLGALRQHNESRRLANTVGVLRSIGLNFLERGKDSTFGGFSQQEYESMKRDTMAGWDEVQRLVASGEAANIEQAIGRVADDSRFPGFRTGFSGNYGADPHTSDTSEFHVASNVGYFFMAINNPTCSDVDFGRAALALGESLSADGYMMAKAGILDVLKDDPDVGSAARKSLDGLPTEAKIRGGINIAWSVISFAAGPAGIVAANSTSSAGGGDYVENVAMALVPFGIARSFAVGAEAVYVARAASLIRNPTLFKAGGFLVGKSAEAAGFTLGNMAMLTVLKGKTDQWTLGHFGQEFGMMLVTFALLHGAGMGLKGLGGWSGRALGRAEADMARALETGSGLQAASFRLRFTSGMNSVAKHGMTAWGTRVLAFTGAEYFNEAIGLKPAEPGVPFWARLLTSAVMDAQMIVAGRSIDALSGGRIGKIEKASHQKYAEHEMSYETQRLLPVVQGMGFDPASPAGRQALQTLLASRFGGESFAAIAKRAESDQATYEKIVQEQMGLDPKSGQGKEAMALLLGYAQNHPFAGPGRPIAAAEVAKHSAEFFDSATKLLQGAGLERHGAPLHGLRQGLVAFALKTGMDPALLAEYAKHAPALKPSLKKAAEAALGPDGLRTPEGQSLIGELLVFSMFRASSPDKMAESLEPLFHPEVGRDLHRSLTAQAELLFGKGGEETPAGRQLMSFLLLREAHAGESLADLPTRIGSGKEVLANAPMLATVTGLSKPAERLALARWALEKGLTGENMKGLTRLVVKGRLELKLSGAGIQVFHVPEGQRSAKAKEVLDRLPELPADLVKADRAGDAKAEQEIFHVTDDMIIPLEPPPVPESALPKVTDDMIVSVEPAKPKDKLAAKEEVLPVTDDMIVPEGDTTKKVPVEAPTKVVKGLEGDVTKSMKPPLSKALAKESADGDSTKVIRKKAVKEETPIGDTKVEPLAARRGGMPEPKVEAGEGGPVLGDSRSSAKEFGAKLSSTDGKIDLSLDFSQSNVLYLGGRAGLRETSSSLETLDLPQAEIAMVKSGGKIAYRLKALAKGKVEVFDSAKGSWKEIASEGLPLKAGQRLRIGGEEVHWEPPVARLQAVGAGDPPFTKATFDALFLARGAESVELVALVETLNTGTKIPENGWISSSANPALPNMAHSPVYGTWKHFSQAETKLDYEQNGRAMSAIAEYRVEIRGEQRLADTVARLKDQYKERLVAVEDSAGRGTTEFILRRPGPQADQGLIRIVLQPKALKLPSADEARQVLADFRKNDLPDLLAVLGEAKTTQTGLPAGTDLRSRYAQSVLDMVGYIKGGEGKEVFGKNLETAIEASEKAASPEDRARASEEVARLVAYLRDVPMLKVEESLMHRSAEFRDLTDIGQAVKWLEASDAKAVKAAWEDYSQLAKYEVELRTLSQELRHQIPQAEQKPGNQVYDEYVAARDRLDGALGRLDKILKSYEGSEAYVKDQAARAEAFKSSAKEEAVLEVTEDMLVPMEGDTKVGRTPPKAKIAGASDKGDDQRIFNQAEIAWLGVFGVVGAENLANPKSAEYGQTLFAGLEFALKNPSTDPTHSEWAITRLVAALRHTAHAEGGEWNTWVQETLNPTLAAYGRGTGGAKLRPIPLSAEQQGFLNGSHAEISADNVMDVIGMVRANSTQVATRKYPRAFAPEPKGVEILNLAMRRYGALIKAQDPQLHEFLQGFLPKTKAQAFPGADPAQGDPVAARRAAAVPVTEPVKLGKLELDAGQGLGADLASFQSDRVYLSETVKLPGVTMTPALRAELKKAESIFEHGGMIIELRPGKPLLMERMSGAETMNAVPAGPEVVKFYDIWKAERSFQPVDAATAKSAYTELKARTDRLGIKLFLGEEQSRGSKRADLEGEIKQHGDALAYLNQLMKLLPDSMLANMHLKQIHLSVPRQGAGLLSSYDSDTGAVYLYSGAFTGSRRYMSALFFHETGHSTAERYSTGPKGDPSIPIEVRQTMESAHATLVKSGAMLGLDWAAGAKDRASYQGSFDEFLAELNFMYVTAGPKLRQHIESFPEKSRERMAWDFVYSEIRDRVFQGREYDYSGLKPTLKPVAAEAKSEPNRDFIPTKDMADGSILELVLSPATDSAYQTKEPHILIPADPSVSETQLFGILTKKGADLWFSPQQRNIRVTDAAGKLKGLRGSQSPVKLESGDTVEVGLFKFKYDGEKLAPDGTLAMRRVDPQPVAAPSTAEGVLQDNTPTQPRQGTYSRQTTAEYGSVSAHTDEGVGYSKPGKPPVNEDGFLQGSNWAIVLDGMGGMGSGDKASAVAGREFQRLMEDPAFNTGRVENLVDAMVQAGDKVNLEVNGGPAMSAESGTAAVAHRILKQPDGSYQVQLAVSGDAAAIIFRPDGHGGYEMRFRTEEQSAVAEGRRLGEITNTLVARRNHLANVVTGGLGLNKVAKPQGYTQTIAPGERMLMFSDGIGDSFSKEELGHILRGAKSAEEAQTRIVEAAHLKMTRLKNGRAAFRDPQQILGLPDGQNGMIGAVAVDGLAGFYMGKDGTIYGRVVEFRDGAGSRQYGIEVPWAKGQYYTENARGEGVVVAGTFSSDRGYYGPVDKYKADNLTVHAYFHDVPGAKAPPGRVKPEPATDPDQTQVFLRPAKASQGSDGSWSFSLQGKQTIALGRNVKEGQILLTDQTVSREHATILLNQGEYFIYDKGSTSGTFVNGQRVPRDASLVMLPGATVQLGNSVFTFQIMSDGSARLTPSN